MALVKRGDIWHAVFQIGGVKKYKSTKTGNKRVAEQLEAKWKGETHTEVIVKGRKPITVKKAVELFLNSRRGTAGWESAEIKTRPFIAAFGERIISEVTAAEVQEVILKIKESNTTVTKTGIVRKKGNSANTANVSLIYWNAIQNHLSSTGYTPAAKTKKMKAAGRVRFLSQQEVTKLLAALHPDNEYFRVKARAQDNYDFVIMLLETGAREQEMAKLQLTQIDEAASTLTIYRSKGGTDTTYPLTQQMKQVIARRQAAAEMPQTITTQHGRTGDGYLFPDKGNPGRTNNDWLSDAAKRAGVPGVSCHVLRHTYACNLLAAGMRIDDVQKLMGHKNLTTTMIYAHVQPGVGAAMATQVLDAQAAAREAAAQEQAVPATQALRLVA